MNEQTGRGMRLKRWKCVCAHCVEPPLIADLQSGARTYMEKQWQN